MTTSDSPARPLRAVVLAAGRSTRMRPLTDHMPKPMLPLHGRPILEWVLGTLRQSGFRDIVITTHYLPRVIEEHFGDGSGFGVKISYAHEDVLLDTAGSLRALADQLGEDFLVCGGHFLLPEVDLAAALEMHRTKKAVATLVLARPPDPRFLRWYGQAQLDDSGWVTRFVEKPQVVVSSWVHSTYQLFSSRALAVVPPSQAASIPDFLIPTLLQTCAPVYGYCTGSPLFNASTPELYEWAQQHHPSNLIHASRSCI